jgi:hypothetical protein
MEMPISVLPVHRHVALSEQRMYDSEGFVFLDHIVIAVP